jgi:hypothetical protein
MFGLNRYKKDVQKLRGDIVDSFDHVKNDFSKVSEWINHLDDKSKNNESSIGELRSNLYALQDDVSEIKEALSFMNPEVSKQAFKRRQTTPNAQSIITDNQATSQTAVQTDVLSDFTVMERAILWAMLNSDMKLSYEDLSALLGKNKSTIRGQINSMKQKNKGLVCEIREANGKKRLYISDKMRDILIKNVKVRVKEAKKAQI